MAEAGTENVFVKVIDVDGETKRCVVIIKTMDDDDETMLMREAPESVPNLEKSELEVSDLVFSPNPSDGHFNLSFELPESTPATIQVYTMEGRKVYNKKIKQPEGVFSEEIDISKSGMSFRIPVNEGKFELDEEMEFRFYFSSKTYIPIKVTVKRVDKIDDGLKYYQFGCSFDKSWSTYPAVEKFIEFIDLFTQSAKEDKGEEQVWLL